LFFTKAFHASGVRFYLPPGERSFDSSRRMSLEADGRAFAAALPAPAAFACFLEMKGIYGDTGSAG